MWLWDAIVLILGCQNCDKKMCSFDSGKPKTQEKIIFEKIKIGLVIGCPKYLLMIQQIWAGDSL